MDCERETFQDTWLENGRLRVQTDKDNDQSKLEDRGAVSGGKPNLPRTTTTNDEIMARQNTNNDNADKDEGPPNDTSMGMQRDAQAKNQATRTMEAAELCHP